MTASIYVAVLAAAGCLSCTNQSDKYHSILMAVDGVKEVGYFLYYEKHTQAALLLTENRYLHIMEFDEAVADKTDFIELFQIGDIRVRCGDAPESREIASGVFNIIEIMRASPLQLKLANVGDIVAHYDEISKYLAQELPVDAVVDGRAVVNASKMIKTKKGHFWCSRQMTSERA